MSRQNQISQLQEISQLLLDARLNDLHQAAAARASSLDHLRELEQPSPAEGLSFLAAADVALRYQRWADLRRVEINRVLARQTAEWLDARDAARTAFGKAEGLKGLLKRGC